MDVSRERRVRHTELLRYIIQRDGFHIDFDPTARPSCEILHSDRSRMTGGFDDGRLQSSWCNISVMIITIVAESGTSSKRRGGGGRGSQRAHQFHQRVFFVVPLLAFPKGPTDQFCLASHSARSHAGIPVAIRVHRPLNQSALARDIVPIEPCQFPAQDVAFRFIGPSIAFVLILR